jgi:hypothetical protein
MFIITISFNTTLKSVKSVRVLENQKQPEDNNKQEKSVINKNQIESLNEYLQHPHDGLSSSKTINFIEENKKNIFRIGNTDRLECKECMDKGDKWYMLQHQCKAVIKKHQQKQSIHKQ